MPSSCVPIPAGVAHADVLPDSKDRRQWRKLQPLHTVTPSTPLTQVGFGQVLPVVCNGARVELGLKGLVKRA